MKRVFLFLVLSHSALAGPEEVLREAAMLALARMIAFAAIPGEPFVQHQLDLRAKCAALPNVFILGLAYSGRGCPFLVSILTAQAVKEGSDGAAECSFLAPDAGARMIEAAANQLR